MFKRIFAAATMITAATFIAGCVPVEKKVSMPKSVVAVHKQTLNQAITAAMGEAREDPRYLKILANYGVPVPTAKQAEVLVNSKDYKYPKNIPEVSLLDRVLKTETLRVGWIAVGAPWAVPGKGKDPVGFSVEYWDIVQDKLNAHYKKNIQLDWVEYTSEVGNNDMYTWLAKDSDHNCATLNTGSVKNCYDVIGGAYAINARRKAVSNITPAYYPLNMSMVRTRTPFKDPTMKLNTAAEIIAAVADPKSGLIIAGYEDTGEHSIMKGWQKKYGQTFEMNFRTPHSNVLEYAETAGAHFVMGTNVRLAVARKNTPQFCSECQFIENILVFGGVGFATSFPDKK